MRQPWKNIVKRRRIHYSDYDFWQSKNLFNYLNLEWKLKENRKTDSNETYYFNGNQIDSQGSILHGRYMVAWEEEGL